MTPHHAGVQPGRPLLRVCARLVVGILLVLFPGPRGQAQITMHPPVDLPVGMTRPQLDSLCASRDVALTFGQVMGMIRTAVAQRGQGRLTVPPPLPVFATLRAVKIALAWLAVLLILGVGALVFSGDHLQRVVETLEQTPGRSVLVGVVSHFAIVPALVGIVIALAVTIIGILLIPFGILVGMFMALGMMTLGYLAVAQVTGRALLRGSTAHHSQRGAALRALMTGIVATAGPWVLASLLLEVEIFGLVTRLLAAAVSFVAVTAGFGAVVLTYWHAFWSRREPPRVTGEYETVWRTPTPVGGVAAVRRP